jgi:hypothetical protein
MSDDPHKTSDQNPSQTGLGLKRRDLLLSGASLLTASALGATGDVNTAQAEQAAPVSTPAPIASTTAEPDRTVLPLAEPTYPPITELDVRKATPPPRFEVKTPPVAPNVLVILLDNLGFGATKTFGGIINMPTLERLAKEGLIYNNFHTHPLCSPSRASHRPQCAQCQYGLRRGGRYRLSGPNRRTSPKRSAAGRDSQT